MPSHARALATWRSGPNWSSGRGSLIAVCREAVGPEGHVVPQQWLTHTSAPGVLASDRQSLDLVVYGASPQGLALCCDATLVSPVTSEGVPRSGTVDGRKAQIRSCAFGGGTKAVRPGYWSRGPLEPGCA